MINLKTSILLFHSIFPIFNAASKDTIPPDSGFHYVIPAKYQDLEFVNDSVLLFAIDNKYGLMKTSGSIIMKPKYHKLRLKHGVLVFTTNGKEGVINDKGEILIEPIYESINAYKSDKIIGAFKNGEYLLFKRDGKLLHPKAYENFYQLPNGYIEVRKDGKVGLLSSNGEVVAKCEFGYLQIWNDNLILFQEGSKKGLMSLKGKKVNKMLFDDIFNFNPIISRGVLNRRIYYLNSKGKLLRGSFEEGLPFEGDVTGVRDNGLWGIIDTKGKWRVKPKYTALRNLGNGLFYVSEDAKTVRIINAKGELVNTSTYLWAGRLNSTLAITKDSNGFDLINQNGKSILPYKFDKITALGNGHGLMYRNKKYGVCNALGEIIIPNAYHAIELRDSLYIAKYNSGGRLIKLNGEPISDSYWRLVLLMPAREQDYTCDSCVFAYIYKLDSVRPINSKGKYLTERSVIPHAHSKASVFMYSDSKGKIGFMDKNSEVIFKPKYDDVVPSYSYDSSQICYATYLDQKWGLINNMGQVIIEPQFDNLWIYEYEGVAHLIKDDEFGLYYIKNNTWLDPQFDEEVEVHGDYILVLKNDLYGLLKIENNKVGNELKK